jgi:ubiquinone/menaquinone biosynthesis C-methylase UbiE
MSDWWNRNAETRIDDFKAWVGESNQPSKVYCRDYIVKKKYKTVMDVGCGLATDFFGFLQDGHEDVSYVGLDSCQFFVNTNRAKGITMIEAELEADLPVSDNYCDVVYCREVLEHLSYYEKTLSELIRMAKKEVIVVFFIKPLEEHQWEQEIADKKEKIKKEFREKQDRKLREELSTLESDDPESRAQIENKYSFEIDPEVKEEDKEIYYWPEEDLYHNKYDKSKLEKFILSMPKVKKIFWKEVQDQPYVVEPQQEEIAEPVEPVDSSEAKEEPIKPEPEKPTGEKIVLHIVLK